MRERLKEGWQRVKFGDVVKLNKDKVTNPAEEGIERYVGLEHLEPGDLRVRSWGLVADGTTFTNYFQPGQVLFGKRRAYQRKVAVADFDGVCSGDIYVFETKDPKVLLPELLPFICQTDAFFDHAVGTSAGSLSPRTNWKSLAQYEFGLPGLEEQKRITNLLFEIENMLEEQNNLETYIGRLFRSYLEHELNPVKNGWGTIEVGELTQVTTGGTPKRSVSEYWSGDIPWVKTGEVDYRKIEDTEEKITQKGINDSAAKLVPTGSVLIAMYGQGPTLGRVAILGVTAATNQACAAIHPSKSIDTKFLFYFLWRQYERIRGYARGATQPNLNLGIIRAIEVPHICVEKQNQIAQDLEDLENSLTEIRLRMSGTLKLKRTILASVFEANNHV